MAVGVIICNVILYISVKKVIYNNFVKGVVKSLLQIKSSELIFVDNCVTSNDKIS